MRSFDIFILDGEPELLINKSVQREREVDGNSISSHIVAQARPTSEVLIAFHMIRTGRYRKNNTTLLVCYIHDVRYVLRGRSPERHSACFTAGEMYCVPSNRYVEAQR